MISHLKGHNLTEETALEGFKGQVGQQRNDYRIIDKDILFEDWEHEKVAALGLALLQRDFSPKISLHRLQQINQHEQVRQNL